MRARPAAEGERVGGASARPTRLRVRDRGGHRILPSREVLRFSAADGAVYAHTVRGRHRTDYTLRLRGSA